jgi:hypothetical protein
MNKKASDMEIAERQREIETERATDGELPKLDHVHPTPQNSLDVWDIPLPQRDRRPVRLLDLQRTSLGVVACGGLERMEDLACWFEESGFELSTKKDMGWFMTIEHAR